MTNHSNREMNHCVSREEDCGGWRRRKERNGETAAPTKPMINLKNAFVPFYCLKNVNIDNRSGGNQVKMRLRNKEVLRDNWKY